MQSMPGEPGTHDVTIIPRMRNLSPDEAAEVIHGGGVIAYPTEAVWGLGCDPFDEAAVLRLLAIKQRDVAKGLILVAARRAQFDGLLDWSTLPSERIAAVDASWPGPHTWIVPAMSRVPRWITGAHNGVAVRVSDHPVVIALCEAFGAPLVSTSANLAGEPPAFSREALDPQLLDQLDGVMEGETGGLSAPTAICDALSGSVLRV
jgi:L-threonylcarbamoyladenylate synthase